MTLCIPVKSAIIIFILHLVFCFFPISTQARICDLCHTLCECRWTSLGLVTATVMFTKAETDLLFFGSPASNREHPILSI